MGGRSEVLVDEPPFTSFGDIFPIRNAGKPTLEHIRRFLRLDYERKRGFAENIDKQFPEIRDRQNFK